MAEEKQELSLADLVNVIKTYTDYKNSLVMTPDDVRNALEMEEFLLDIEAKQSDIK